MWEDEQQPGEKLEQLDAEVEAVVHLVARDWTYLEVRAKVGQTKGKVIKVGKRGRCQN